MKQFILLAPALALSGCVAVGAAVTPLGGGVVAGGGAPVPTQSAWHPSQEDLAVCFGPYIGGQEHVIISVASAQEVVGYCTNPEMHGFYTDNRGCFIAVDLYGRRYTDCP